jgi:hypothetical protein
LLPAVTVLNHLHRSSRIFGDRFQIRAGFYHRSDEGMARRVELAPRDFQLVKGSVPIVLAPLPGIDRRAGLGDKNLVAGDLPRVPQGYKQFHQLGTYDDRAPALGSLGVIMDADVARLVNTNGARRSVGKIKLADT